MKITTLFMFSALAALSFPTTSCVSEEVSNSIMLRSAARRNDWNEFTKLASTGAKMDPQEATKLLVRYAEGELPGAPSGLASALISMGADVNAQDGNGHSLLYSAGIHGKWNLFRTLASAGAKTNAQEATELLALYSRGKLPDAPSGLASELVSMGADVNAQDGNGHSLLYSAGIRDWIRFRRLASAGAKMSAQEATELLALCAEGKRSVISPAVASSLVSMGADVNAQDGNGRSLLAVAVDRKNWLMFSALVAAGAKMDPQEATKLLVRYAKGDIFRAPDGLASALISAGADVNAQDGNGHSLLYSAGIRDWRLFRKLASAGAKMSAQEATELLALCAEGKRSVISRAVASSLVSMGADVNAQDGNGRSLLAVAVDRENWRMFSALVSAGAKMSVEEAADLLVLYAKGELSGAPSDIVSVLVSMGAECKNGHSLLYSVGARENWNLFATLVSAGAKMSVEEATDLLVLYAKGVLSGAPSDVVPVLVSMGADVNAKDENGHSLLYVAKTFENREAVGSGIPRWMERYIAKSFGNQEAVSALTAAGAKMTPEEKQGFRYFLMSFYIRDGEWRKIAEAVENKEIYLTDISPSSGQNAFHAVAQIGRDDDIDESFLVALKNAGVDVNKKDAEGFSPLATAIKEQNEKAVAALLKYGANPSDSIPIQGAFGHAGEKKLMNYAIELHNESVGRLNEAIRQRNSMPISAGTPYPHSIRYRGPRGVENYNYDQRTLNESFERRIQEANSQISTRRQVVDVAKTIVSLMARATGTEVSDM